ncbi:MAG: hypothetical protein ACRD3C_10940 [Vicinamibacterales bacterium]
MSVDHDSTLSIAEVISGRPQFRPAPVHTRRISPASSFAPPGSRAGSRLQRGAGAVPVRVVASRLD